MSSVRGAGTSSNKSNSQCATNALDVNRSNATKITGIVAMLLLVGIYVPFTDAATITSTKQAEIITTPTTKILDLSTNKSTDSPASSGQLILQDKMVTYFDGNEILTIVGNIKNEHTLHIKPALTLYIQDEDSGATYDVVVPYGVIPAGGELPFQVKVPGASQSAELERYEIDILQSYPTLYQNTNLNVIYDHTLVVHQNGSLTGFAINSGDTPIHDPVILAVVHGEDGAPLDVSRSMPLGTILSGQIIPFEMHADPTVSSKVAYYSCFVPSESWIHPLTAKRSYDNGDVQEYKLRYESGAWLYRPVFVEDGTSITIQTTNSYPFETYANIEVPPVTGEEEFDVYRNEEPINHTQSIDEMGMWHLAFEIRGHSQDVITIRGFEIGDTLVAKIPDYVRYDMTMWASGEADDKVMIDALLLLSDHELLPPIKINPSKGPVTLPDWLATIIIWWDTHQIDDDQITGAISHMIKTSIIRQE